MFYYSLCSKSSTNAAQSYNIAMLSGVQLRCVDVLLPPGDLRPFAPPPSAELLDLEPIKTPDRSMMVTLLQASHQGLTSDSAKLIGEGAVENQDVHCEDPLTDGCGVLQDETLMNEKHAT